MCTVFGREKLLDRLKPMFPNGLCINIQSVPFHVLENIFKKKTINNLIISRFFYFFSTFFFILDYA
jgi:hypothetical protein